MKAEDVLAWIMGTAILGGLMLFLLLLVRSI